MPIQISEEGGKTYLRIHCSGKVHKTDYAQFVPGFERALEKDGAVRVLFDLTGFEGWDLGALWEELKFDYKHVADIQKCAVLGDKKWEQAMTSFFKPFTKAKVSYFEHSDSATARKWLLEA